jgi:hypothetical protein
MFNRVGLTIGSAYVLWACTLGLPQGAGAGDRACAAAEATGTAELERVFRSPPDAAKPWAYWWWLNANVTRESITRDLEEMKQQGLGGFLLFDVTGYGQQIVPSPPRRVEFLSPAWRELVKHALQEANRLGLEMSMNLSTCGGALRAPWKTGQQAPKDLLWASAEVLGPARVTVAAPPQQGPRMWDAALVAARIGDAADAKPSSAAPGGPIQLGADRAQLHPVVVKPTEQIVATEVVDLTGKLDAQGRLVWDVPAGRWRLLRFVFALMDQAGLTGAAQESAASDVDMLDAQAVRDHFRRFAGAVLSDAGPLVGKTLTHFYSVSWEGAIPTWTFGFDREFAKYRGYAVRPYLPVLAGLTVRKPEVTQRFLRDYCRTLSDCFMHNCYGTLDELCRQAGVQWHSESGGPWRRQTLLFAEADAFAFWGRNDMPQGEFWWGGKPEVFRSNARLTANAAHIYGRPLASIEAFTHMQNHWSAYPATLKPGADNALCDGINRFVWHTFSASPKQFGLPGIVYFAGTHLNPNVTWWRHAGAVLGYLGRCQALLRQGRFVADVCCYRSDRNYADWSSGTRRGVKPMLTLPKGYAGDVLNTEVLVERLAVRDGRLVLPDGMSYGLLLVDPEEDTLPPESLRKIIQLVHDGATVVLGSRRPQRAPGLTGYPACEDELRRLVTELWGASGDGAFKRRLGKGKLIGGTEIEQVLVEEGIRPDCAGPWPYIHRTGAGFDVYFIAGTGRAEHTFRVQGREPELWDPLSGTIRDAVCYRTTDDGRTIVPLELPENGSVFVVFRRPAEPARLVAVSGPPGGLEIAGRSGRGARLRLWQSGRYTLETPAGTPIVLDATLPESHPLAGPWQVQFDPAWGGPASIVFDRLMAWDQHPDDGIKHYSGTATYRKTFQLDAVQVRQPVRLQLGDVKYVARVRINRKDLGVVWTAPWTADLSGGVREGENELEIDVTNLWANRLIGDAALAPERRRTRTNIHLQNHRGTLKPYQGYGADDPLLPSGLLGPARLEFGQEREVRF